MLRFTGLPFMDCVLTGKNKMPTILETTVSSLSIMGIFFVIVMEFRTLVSIWQEDTMYALSTVPTILSVTLSLSKGVRFVQKRLELKNLLQKMALLWETSFHPNMHITTVDEMLDKLTIIRNIYFVVIVGGVVFYSLPVYADIGLQYFFTKNENNSYNYTQMIFPIVYPFTLRTAFPYFAVIAVEQILVIIAITMWASCDTLFAHVVTYAAIHFRVLRHELENIFNSEYPARPDDIINLKIAVIAKRHLELFSLCNAIEDIFSPLVMLSMLLSASNMCITMYEMEKMLSMNNYVELATNLIHLCALFLMVLTFCGFATMLSDQTEGVSLGAYGSNWFTCDPVMKILLIFIMMRAQKPFHCTAYGFFPISLNQVTAIFSSALSYFSILRTMT
ncbi:putative odorant receptor 92a [Orussus abietinus]|uniref:putative odorant receptor 92a n=1 Tax=Orussus abietinus TaxID=222816 RepID=UPI000626C128|nr:putative odorant receptor 92a [Orussus abietinus]